MALPNIVTNITVPLLGMVDMAIVGHLSGAHVSAIVVGIITPCLVKKRNDLHKLLYINLCAGPGKLP